jgi:uncharacterized protein YeaO (DUF488 family)
MPIVVKRIYDMPAPGDGYRVLADRLWPRGVAKEGARIDEWLKAAAPSTELRQWFHADRSRWDEFCSRYAEELKEHDEVLVPLVKRARKGRVTLLTANRDTERNHALVLKEHLDKMLRGTARKSG